MSWQPYPSHFHPAIPYPIPLSTPWHLTLDPVDVRTQLEEMTSPMGVPLDFAAHALVHRWCQSIELRQVVVDVLKARIALGTPRCLKALFLADHLPPDDLADLDLGDIKDDAIAPLINSLKSRAEESKTASAAQTSAETWTLWSSLYGKSETGWVPLPEEMRAKDPPEWETTVMIGVPLPTDSAWTASDESPQVR